MRQAGIVTLHPISRPDLNAAQINTSRHVRTFPQNMYQL